MIDVKKLENTISWCNEYIAYYRAGNYFDPLKYLQDDIDKRDKLFVECIDYLDSLESMIDQFKKTRDKLVFRGLTE